MQVSQYLDLKTCGFSTASGGSTVEIDCQNCDGVLLLGVPGTTAARTWSIALKTGRDDNGVRQLCEHPYVHELWCPQ